MTIAELVARLSLDDSGFASGLSGAQSKLKASTVAMGNIMSGLITKGARMFGSIIKTGADFNAEIETMTVSFATMTGSTEKAAEMVERLKKMGAETPFETGDLVKTTQLLMQYGFTADDAIAKMSMLGDISQGNAQAMTSIATGYAQMSSAGKVNLQDIKQMINGGFNPLQEIAERTGESMASLYDRISKGTMQVSEITASMEAATSEGGKYYNSMINQSKTMSGQISTLKDNWKNLTGGIIEPFTMRLTDTILPKLNEKLGDFASALLGVDESVADELPDISSELTQWRTDLMAEWTNGLAEDETTVNEYITRLKETTGKLKDAITERVKSVSELGTSTANVTVANLKGIGQTIEAQEKELADILAQWAGKIMPPEVVSDIEYRTQKLAALKDAIGGATGGLSEENVTPWEKFADTLTKISGTVLDNVTSFITDIVTNWGEAKETITGIGIAMGAALAILSPSSLAKVGIAAGVAYVISNWEKVNKFFSDLRQTIIDVTNMLDPIHQLKELFGGDVSSLEPPPLELPDLSVGLDGNVNKTPKKYGTGRGVEEVGASAEQATGQVGGLVGAVLELESAETSASEGANSLSEGISKLTEMFPTLPSPEELAALSEAEAEIGTSADAITGFGFDALKKSVSEAKSKIDSAKKALEDFLKNDGKSVNISMNFSGSIPNIGKGQWETGLGYVPYNNYATTLDEGEMVLTKAQAEAYRKTGKPETGGASIDYDRMGAAVARALTGFGIDINGKRAGSLLQKNNMRANNAYMKSLALGVGK